MKIVKPDDVEETSSEKNELKIVETENQSPPDLGVSVNDELKIAEHL